MIRWKEILKKFNQKGHQYSEKELRYLDGIADKQPGKIAIPDEIAIISGVTEDPSDKKILLNFDYFQEKECKISQANASYLRVFIRVIKRITSSTRKELEGSNFIRDSIRRDTPQKDYQRLFFKIPPDISTIYEANFLSGRIFFFIIENIFYFISIEESHRNTN